MPLRNALAHLAISALEDDTALAALEWLARPARGSDPPAARLLATVHLIDPGEHTLLPVHEPHAAGVAAHAQRALRAASVSRQHSPAAAGDAIARAAHHAAALWNEGLFFEVHEVLEEVWKTARGDARQALQGVIQIAVAYHHLAHGNLRGARNLLKEGRSRLTPTPPAALPTLDLPSLIAATAPWETALARGELPAADLPRLCLRPAGG